MSATLFFRHKIVHRLLSLGLLLLVTLTRSSLIRRLWLVPPSL